MPETLKIHNSQILVTKGDITLLEVPAFVFYAQHDLQLGTGFGTAVSQRGGPSIQEELDKLGPLATTEVVASAAGSLKAEWILHAVGPRFMEEDIPGKLRTTMLNCLREADAKGVTGLAFPAMGAGFYGIPLDVCAETMLAAIRDYLCQETKITEVTVCLLDDREYKPFVKQLSVLGTAKAQA